MDDSEIVEKIHELVVLHRDIDTAIQAMIETGKSDMIQIQRLKKRKLLLRDRITLLEDELLPDIIA